MRSTLQRGGLQRVDLRQMPCDALPAPAVIAAGPDFAAGGTHVQAHWIARIAAHGLALHGPPGVLLRHALVEALPASAGIARTIRRRLAFERRAGPYRAAIHRKHPADPVVARMHDQG